VQAANFWRLTMRLETSTKTNAAKNPTVIRKGFTTFSNAIISLDLSPKEKLVYIVLLSYDWYKEGCYPSRDRLSKETKISERVLVDVIKKLEEKGLVIIKRRGDGQTNYYT
jgi:DNA-binding MarR family transcriptional regulator